MFAQRKEFVCDAAKHSASLVAFWLRLRHAVYEHDVIIDRGEIRKRKKKPLRRFREQFGPTPLLMEEEIPWKGRQLVVGSGA
jgi:hypothetical protein